MGRDFAAGSTYWTSGGLAAQLDIPSTALAPVLACLERGGLIVATEKEEFLPGRDLAGIRLIDIIDAVRTRHPGRLMIDMDSLPSAAQVMHDLESAIREELGEGTPRDWLDDTPA